MDLRSHRLRLAADSKRNLLLLSRFCAGGIPAAKDAVGIIGERPEILRTLPVFYPIQAARSCPQSCAFCPYPALNVSGEEDFLDSGKFGDLLDRIAGFSGDAVIDLSLWGELVLHLLTVPSRLILLKGKVKEKPRRENIYHEGAQRIHEGPDSLASSLRPTPGNPRLYIDQYGTA